MPSSTVILISQDPGLIKNTKQWAKDQSVEIQVFSYTEWENYVNQPIAIKEAFESTNETLLQLKKMGIENKDYDFYDEKKGQSAPMLPTSGIDSNHSNRPSTENTDCKATHPSLSSVPSKTLTPHKKTKTMNEIENHAIQQAILEFNGNLTEAAKALAIGRATLYRKVKQYNIDLAATRKKMAAS